MKSRQNNNVVYYVSVIIIVLFFGCSVEQTHKTFTFFFDGVDKVIFFNDYLSKDSLSKDAIAKREGLLKKVRPEQFVHLPYKEKKCEKCHTPDKRLIMAMPDLCFQCHKNFAESYTTLHGPVASGNCTKCHNQHSSKYPKLLTRQGQQVCTYCHSPSLIFANKVHRDIEDAECTLCHNPHGGNRRFMVKNNIPTDPNRIALMTELTSRSLCGQIFCKEPGDVTSAVEIKIYDGSSKVVATVRPDNTGKFYLTNMHPGQNYTFDIKGMIPECKVNIMDCNGSVLIVVERNKKGKYVLDKSAYETVHEALNTANAGGNYLGETSVRINLDKPLRKDSAKTQEVIVAPAEPEKIMEPPVINNVPDPSKEKGKIHVKELPENVSLKDLVDENKKLDTKETTGIAADNKPADSVKYKGKIVVKTIPGNVKTSDLIEHNKDDKQNDAGKRPSEPRPYKGKIVVGDEPGNTKEINGKLKNNAGGTEAIRKYERDNITLVDLANQINRLYDGNTICVLNDSADYIDIARVDKKGRFLLFDFLAYRLTLPDKSSGIISQTIFLNDKMEIIETVNKRVKNGRYIYVSNSKEYAASRADVKIIAEKENAALFSTIYYEQAKASISDIGITELDKVVNYLKDHPAAKVYLAAHTDSRGSIGYNLRLSEDRAKAAIKYLNTKGINSNRISGKGYGKEKPLDTYVPASATEEEQQKNRRVEIYIKDK